MQTTTTTTTTTATNPQLLLDSEATNYANAANRIAADVLQMLKKVRKRLALTAENDLVLAYCANGAKAAARKACEHASSARANTHGSYLHGYNTNRAADHAYNAEKYSGRFYNVLAEIEMGQDDEEGW